MSQTPRHAAKQAEQAHLPGGHDERFSGYGIMGLPFVSGHVLGLRRFPASSVGPGYFSVWHRSPDGRWTFYTDTEPMRSCNRYFGKAIAAAIATPIHVSWPAEDRIDVSVPGVIEWESRLERDAVAAVMSTIGRLMPEAFWRSRAVLSMMSAVASRVLGAGRLSLKGIAPNGQGFIASPRLIWFIPESKATVDGVYLGPVGALREQASLGSFMIPQRGIFVVGGAAFDIFDPSRHYATATRTAEVASLPSSPLRPPSAARSRRS